MIMPPHIRNLALTAHITASVGSLGAVACFLVLGVAGLTSEDARIVRAAYLAMELTARFVIVPLVLASLLTGLSSRSVRRGACSGTTGSWRNSC